MTCLIRKASATPALTGQWDAPPWDGAETLEISHFYRGADHRPRTRAKLLHDENGLYVMFDVQDRYVRCVNSGFNASVYRDSCAELFIAPRPQRGYFNFETNCGGSLLTFFIEDATRTGQESFRKYTRLPPELLQTVRIHHSMPPVVDPEITEPVNWRLEYFVPRALFERYLGPLGPLGGQVWRGNLYKCGDDTSHPHWGSWAPLGEKLDFHQPQSFGELRLE